MWRRVHAEFRDQPGHCGTGEGVGGRTVWRRKRVTPRDIHSITMLLSTYWERGVCWPFGPLRWPGGHGWPGSCGERGLAAEGGDRLCMECVSVRELLCVSEHESYMI